MYGHSKPMNVHHHQIPADDDEDGATGDTIDRHHHMSFEDGSGAAGIVVEDVSPDSVYITGGSDPAIQGADVSSQLTLTFRGQVYVFDDVTPDKVHAVLLLLGGCELTLDPHGLEAVPHGQRGLVVDYPGRCSQPQRAASLHRFRQKRKERCFDKKVRYSVRQEVALSVIRVNLLPQKNLRDQMAGVALRIQDKMTARKRPCVHIAALVQNAPQ